MIGKRADLKPLQDSHKHLPHTATTTLTTTVEITIRNILVPIRNPPPPSEASSSHKMGRHFVKEISDGETEASRR